MTKDYRFTVWITAETAEKAAKALEGGYPVIADWHYEPEDNDWEELA